MAFVAGYWILMAHHTFNLLREFRWLFDAAGWALLVGALFWMFYIALEPFYRATSDYCGGRSTFEVDPAPVTFSTVIAMILSASMICTSPHRHVTVTGSGTFSGVISANTAMRTPHLQRKPDAIGDIEAFSICLNVPLRYQIETHYVDV
jgi:hypothetical protein